MLYTYTVPCIYNLLYIYNLVIRLLFVSACRLPPRYSTPLHDAVCCGRQEIAAILLERGANVNEVDYKNQTPLKLSIRYGQEEIEGMLRSRGAKETVEVERKVSTVEEVFPPWVRKSSRREPQPAA